MEKSVITQNGMLTDRHMHAVNKLLKREFPQIDGLHSTLLVQTGGFPPIRTSSGSGKHVTYLCILLTAVSFLCSHSIIF